MSLTTIVSQFMNTNRLTGKFHTLASSLAVNERDKRRNCGSITCIFHDWGERRNCPC
jgi:hypothetical protein